MSERESFAVARGLDRERGQEPSLATATRKGAPGEAPARQGQERET
jgi:hypothetical protein